MRNIGTASTCSRRVRGVLGTVEHAEQLLDRKTVLRSDREYDAVVVGAGLQLEIEGAAKASFAGPAPSTD